MANPNPNTSGLTPFQKGSSPNPGGKTSAQRKLEVQNAELATRIANKMLNELGASMEGLDGQGVLDMIRGDVLKLIKDSQDRGLGSPRQVQEISGPDGGAIPTTVSFKITIPDGE